MRRFLAPAPLALLATAALLAGCGGSGSSSAPPATTSTTPAASDSTSAAPTGNAPADVAAAKAEITTNWETFLHSGTPHAKAITLLENGANLGPALHKATAEDKATGGKRSAHVTTITFTSPTQANVIYTLKAAGRTLNSSGVAVLQDGTWKVSDITFCTLVVLGNGERPVKGCAS